MVEIEEKKVFVLSYRGSKPVTFDKKEMLASFEGKTFLRLRPTNAQIVALVSKHTAAKNASLSQSVQLQKLLDLRNIAAKYGPAASQNGEEEGQEPEWEAPPPEAVGFPVGRSSGMPKGTYCVQVQVAETTVNVLLLDAARPKRSDLFVELEVQQLTAVLDFLQEGLQEALQCETRWKKAKKQKVDTGE